MDYKTIYATMHCCWGSPSALTGVAVTGSESVVSKTMEERVAKKSIGGCQIKMMLMQRNAIVDELEDNVLSDSVRLSSSFYMCSSQSGFDQHRINWSAGVHRNKTKLDDTGGQDDTVETIGIVGTYHRSTLPAPLVVRGSYVAKVITIVDLETISR